MRVLIADGHDVVRPGLKEILLEAFPGTCCSEASNGELALKRMAESRFDLLLLDINMPGNDGFAVLREAKRNHPGIPVIIVSVHPEDQYAERCTKAGAAAYIKKDRASDELVEAVKTIVGSRMDISGAV